MYEKIKSKIKNKKYIKNQINYFYLLFQTYFNLLI